MKIITIILSILMFSGLATGVGLFFNGMMDHYNVPNSKNISSLSKADEMYTFLNQSTEDVKNSKNFFLTIFTSAGLVFGALIRIFTLPTIIIDIATETVNLVGIAIPGWVILMITGFILAIIIYRIVSAILGKDL